TLYAHLEESPPAPAGLEQVMGRALAKSPDERYPTCSELVAAALAALGLEPRRARWTYALAAVGIVLLGAALLAFFLTRGNDGTASGSGKSAGDGRVLRIDTSTGKLTSAVPFGSDLSDIAVGSGEVWIASLGSGSLGRIDPVSGRLDKAIPVARSGSGPSG